MGEGFGIPAATVQDVDLSATDTTLAAEIRRLGNLMERGDETPEEFAQLVRLLVVANQPAKAEYLLRRNLEGATGGLAFYRELFGTAKPDEFGAAIQAFVGQFGIGLELSSSRSFLDNIYRMQPGPPRTAAFALFGEPFKVRFDFSEPDFVAAEVSSESSEQYLLLRWVGSVWERVELRHT